MNKVVFFGDSITASFQQLQSHSNVINMGISGDKIHNLIGRIEEIISLKPDRLFILIGVNDLLNEKEFWGSYIKVDFKVVYYALTKLIKDNLPNTEVFLQSILPISINHKDVELYNKIIRQMNTTIQGYAEVFGWTYLDLYSKFQTKDNLMNPIYTTDGVHLSIKGYNLFYQLIHKYL